MVSTGDEAPTFTAPLADGDVDSFTLDDRLDEAPIVLAFFPGAFTGVCTHEMNTFQDRLGEFSDAGATVYGVSIDTPFSQNEFKEQLGLEFDLLADPDGDLAEAFGVDTSEGYTERVTFVLANGEVTHAYEGVKPDGHARNVLEDILDDGLATLD